MGAVVEVELERELVVRYRVTGDITIRDELIERHRGLAFNLARRFSGRGEPLDDLVEVAMIGLLGRPNGSTRRRATPSPRSRRRPSWTSCAATSVTTPGPRRCRARSRTCTCRVRPAAAGLRTELGRSPTVPELALHLGCSDEKVIEALEVSGAYRADSIHTPAAGDDGLTLEDQLATDGDPLHTFKVVETIRSILARLPGREHTVPLLRFYDELSQSEIAKRVGLSQMHVSRIVRATLERLSRSAGVTSG